MKRRPLTYRAAGVDIDLKERLIPRLRRLAEQTGGKGVIGGIGGFGALFDIRRARRMRSPVLVAGADGVGTKLKVAVAAGKHDTVGIDCVAMCVNDIVCHAAEPLFFLDYIACGRLDMKLALTLVRGIARGCRQAGMSLVGGETAQMPGMYHPGEYDLAGFALGIVERARIPVARNIRPGDLLVGLASNGLHSNGFSLIRKIFLQRGALRLDSHVPELGCTLAEELLRPTRIYAKIAYALFSRFRAKGLAHITGGGIVENLPRVMPPGVHAILERRIWRVPAIFDLVARLGRIEREEMDRTFNNGLGMIAVLPPARVPAALEYLRQHRQPAWIVGEVRSGGRGVSLV